MNNTVLRIDKPLSMNVTSEDTNGTENEPPKIAKKLLINPIKSGSNPIKAENNAKNMYSTTDFTEVLLNHWLSSTRRTYPAIIAISNNPLNNPAK